jgi:hypothetical protein
MSTLMMEAETVSETMDCNSRLTWMVVREGVIVFSSRESFKFYMLVTRRTVDLKMTVFWGVAPCSLVEIDRHFRGAYCLYHQGDECWKRGTGALVKKEDRERSSLTLLIPKASNLRT